MSDHPEWCVGTACTADRPPLYGHQVGAHWSSPEVVGATVLRLAQAPDADRPWVELRRGDDRVVLPPLEARSLGLAIGDLLGRAGLSGMQTEPGS
ncbi:hypothetical protein GCM10010399_64200 [Dactylosporangium fulvum]|uniref:Uncharacterized protein n=1 Tax=Dactylosporangium fulvum TaxID=53359 RepID=A0ABY5W796_9ACTN|nr:hypothetical protein [Dactylosporangium fulvum]UWP85757.1 hypothetical protein Dfulv_16555 [Dactylosporangium fulvum]